jgi:hypothetical protein
MGSFLDDVDARVEDARQRSLAKKQQRKAQEQAKEKAKQEAEFKKNQPPRIL